MVEQGVVEALPITYEDFLFSAAGIFQSNLGTKSSASEALQQHGDKTGLRQALGCPIVVPEDLYEAIQKQNLEQCFKQLRQLGVVLGDVIA